jgi:hypothetical protein
MRRVRTLFAVPALLLAVACADDSTGTGGPPQAGTLIVRLTTTHSDDGAVLLELSGPPIDSVVALNASLQLFTRRANDSTIVAAVVGVVGNGAVVTLRVPDVGAAGQYTARVLEVADRQNILRASLTGYALTVGP